MSTYIGRELSGYRILEQIGQGGMAKVFKAYQPAFDRVVALKVLPDLDAEDPTIKARFRQEARIIASLEHPHILPVHDFGEDDETVFLVMRYLQAGNLKNLLSAAPGGKFSLPDAALLIEHIASALDYAHQQGIVHRDVKPANILIDIHGQAFLTDFGVAKVMEDTSHLTKTGSALGTPAYMSPEQAAGKEVDCRSDVYSLGIILYQMLLGRTPFEADTPYATIIAHINEPLPLPSLLNPDLPQVVERVILKALAKDPEARFQTAGELSNAFFAALEGLGEEIPEGKFSSQILGMSSSLAEGKPSEDLTVDDQEMIKHITRERRRKKLLPWGIGIILFAVLIGGGIIIRNMQNQLSDPAWAGELVQQITQTAAEARMITATQVKANQNATATLNAKNKQATQTIVALTPTSTSTPTHTPTLTQTPEYIFGRVLIEDNFETSYHSLRQFNTLDGYQIQETDNGNHILVISNQSEYPNINEIGVSYLNKYWSDYCITFDLRFVKTEDTPLSIIIRQDDPSGYLYNISFSVYSNSIQLNIIREKPTLGIGINLGTVRIEKYINRDDWNNISICLYKDQISADINSHILIRVIDTNPPSLGGFWFSVGSERDGEAIIELDNLVVTELLPRP